MTEFPSSPWDFDLAPDEWAAYLLLRDPDLLNARDAEQAAFFYNPKTRTLAPDGDPVFESKVENARLRREKSVRNFIEYRRLKTREPDFEDLSEAYHKYDGEEEFEFDRCIADWRALEAEQTRLQREGVTEVVNEDGERRTRVAHPEELDQVETECQLARHQAELAWSTWRAKLMLYVNRIRLASLIIARRNETKLTQEQFATFARVSGSTIKNFENVDQPGKWFSVDIIERMEVALGWEAGSITAVLRGGDPVPLAHWSKLEVGLRNVLSGQIAGASQSLGSVNSDTDGRIVVRLDTESMDLVRELAVSEMRAINAVVEDAIRFYAKFHLSKES